MTRSFDYMLKLTVIVLGAGILLVGAWDAEAKECLSGNDVSIIEKCNVPAGAEIGPDLKTITIKSGGTLNFQDGAGVTKLTVNSIIVEDGGTLQAGTPDKPIGSVLGPDKKPTGGLIITFTGSPNQSPCDGDWCGKGIYVKKGGSLLLYGAKGVPTSGVSWTYLNDAAGPLIKGAKVQGTGPGKITLASSVTADNAGAWRKGDWIAVATTSFSPFETEFVQLDADPTDITNVTLSAQTPLKNYHFGSLDPGPPSAANYLADKTKNYGIDERAEVGLISRSIKLTATIDPANPSWGGEIKIVGFNDTNIVALQGVELEKFGKARLGSYPIHLHMIGTVPDKRLVLNANSIHHSFNKCITIHSTQNATIQNNVCVRIVGHIFYQEIGDEFNITYLNNLGLGAMSHNFDIAARTPQEDKFWGGDYLASSAGYNYSGLNVPNTDSQKNPVRGTCASLLSTGELSADGGQTPQFGQYLDKDCPAENPVGTKRYYFEPPSGFWIVNPTTVLMGNSIGGCQGVGVAYWYVLPKNLITPTIPESLRELSRTRFSTFKNNRAHGCFDGVFAESQYEVFSDQPLPTKDGQGGSPPVFTLFEGLTATRIRDRGIWIRPSWSVLRHGRFATNKASVILVSSGGLDGNAPGFWALLEQSVIVGISQNNVDRWGPCPVANSAKGVGCVDLTSAAKDIVGDGYPLPAFTLLGYQIYDGPVRIFKDRFVNFNRDVTPDLTDDDKTFLSTYTAYFPSPPKLRYEGDAALGWFKANQSAYPNATVSNELTFENVTLRHQVFTSGVNYGDFQDGDRNTVILDGDGSLTGLQAVDASGKVVLGAVSLNNLGYNQAGANSVDECLAEGQQDTDVETRPTALMSPQGVATLELQANFPPSSGNPTNPALPKEKQRLTFTKDNKDFCESGGPCTRQTLELTSRNGLGIWEPKVVSGYGYTVAASKCANPPACTTGDAGIPKRVSVGLTDAIKPAIGKSDPFRLRLGICYTGSDGVSRPNGNFTITRGYRSWGPGGGVNPSDPELQQFFNSLTNRYPKAATQTCTNLDVQTCTQFNDPLRVECKNLDPDKGCPGNGVIPIPKTGGNPNNDGCPDGTTFVAQDEQNQPACIYPKTTLQPITCTTGNPAECIKRLTDTTYFYDKGTGMLYFNVVQDAANAHGPSPLGSCPGDPSCPDVANGESYYGCPAQGCTDYVIQLNDSDYLPGESNCSPYEQFAQDEPTSPYRLVGRGAKKNDGTFETFEIKRVFDGGKSGQFPHYKAVRADTNQPLTCSATASPDTDVAGRAVDGGPVDGGPVDVGPSDTGG